MVTTIYLVRHGDVDNPDKLFYGRLPGFGLSPLGNQQAAKLGEHLREKKIAAIYHSPLVRTTQTAAHIHKHHPHLTPTPDERLIEVFSPLQGRSFAELESINWNWFLPEYIEAGGERMEDIWQRMEDFFLEKVAQHAGEEIVVVSHGDPIMVSKTMVSGVPLTFEALRGPDYAETATGFALAFKKNQFSHLAPLIP